jgi:dolichyl-phosphate beta-glucosyltransferase
MIKPINSLSIIIPIFNEEKRLTKSLIKIKKFIKNKKIEVIFVNDGSVDLSKKIIQDFVKKNKKINIINLKKNIGKGGALKKGIERAKKQWILTLDLDLSVPITQILLWSKNKYIDNNFLIYFGSRSDKKSKIKSKIYRNVIGKTLSILINFILRIKIADTQCGFKLYNKSVAKKIFSKITRLGYEHDIEIVLIAKNNNIAIKELPVSWTHKSGSKVNIIVDSIKVLFSIIILRIRY